jgi:hypothetical protein
MEPGTDQEIVKRVSKQIPNLMETPVAAATMATVPVMVQVMMGMGLRMEPDTDQAKKTPTAGKTTATVPVMVQVMGSRMRMETGTDQAQIECISKESYGDMSLSFTDITGPFKEKEAPFFICI